MEGLSYWIFFGDILPVIGVYEKTPTAGK